MGAMTHPSDPPVRTNGFVTKAEFRIQIESHESMPAIFKTTKAEKGEYIKPSSYKTRRLVIFIRSKF